MGQKTPIQLKAALCAELTKYLEMQRKTKEASIAASEAEQQKQALYAVERKQGIQVIELWKKVRAHDYESHGYVKLPDGRVVKIDQNLIFDCSAIDL